MSRKIKPGNLSALGVALAMLLSITLLLGCLPDDDDTLGDRPDLTGIWEGTQTDELIAAVGALTLTVSQSGLELTGTYVVIFPTITLGGNFLGFLNDQLSGGTFELRPSLEPNCLILATVSIIGRTASGNYSSTMCFSASNGSLEVTKTR